MVEVLRLNCSQRWWSARRLTRADVRVLGRERKQLRLLCGRRDRQIVDERSRRRTVRGLRVARGRCTGAGGTPGYSCAMAVFFDVITAAALTMTLPLTSVRRLILKDCVSLAWPASGSPRVPLLDFEI